jgi:O-acetylserine/cysteine efflux transporter
LQGVLLALLGAALWGFAPVATKAALTGYAPEVVSVVRLGLAAVLFRLLGGGGTRWLPADGWSWLAGVALGADFALYNWGLRFTTAAVAGLLINVEVVSGILLARWLLRERLTARRVAGAGVTLAGVGWVASEGVDLAGLADPRLVAGNAAVMTAALCWSLFAIAQRRAPRRGNLFALLAPIFVVAFGVTLPGLLLPGARYNPGGLAATVLLAVLVLACTVAVYLVYARSQELVDVTVLTVVLASIPVFSVAFAWLVLGEPLTARVLTGGGLVLAGVLFTALER